MDKQRRKQIVIAGGGITGLSTAYYVEQLCRAHAIEVEIVLVEKSDRFGGHVHTGKKDGFVIERGPDSFLARKTSIIELMQELGIGDDIVGTRPGISHSYIAYRNQLHPIPDGFMLGVPTKWKPFITTKLLSVRGKVRAAADLVLPRRPNVEDESLGQLLRRRLGDEVLEQIAEPLLAGIYAGNADALSVQATFPMLQETEQKHRSLIVGMLGVRKSRAPKQTTQSSQTTSKTGSGNGSGSTSTVKKSMFLSARGGLEEVVTHLEKALSSSINMMKNTEISGVTHEGDGYVVHLHNGEKLHADAMVMATPAHIAARLLPDQSISELLQTIPYASVMNVILAYRQQDVGISLDASGFVVPRKEGRTVTACTWTSSKWAHTAPEGHILLRAYVGKYGQENNDQLSDEKLVNHVRHELEEMMGISAEPIFTEVNRLPDAMPQYKVGHLERMQELDDALANVMPGVYLGGGGYRGIGVPDCISQGKVMANKLLTRLVDISV